MSGSGCSICRRWRSSPAACRPSPGAAAACGLMRPSRGASCRCRAVRGASLLRRSSRSPRRRSRGCSTAPPPARFGRLADDADLADRRWRRASWRGCCPALAFWLLAGGVARRRSASSTPSTPMRRRRSSSGVALAPGGVLVAGRQMLATLAAHGIRRVAAVLDRARRPAGDGRRVGRARRACSSRSICGRRRPSSDDAFRRHRRRLRRADSGVAPPRAARSKTALMRDGARGARQSADAGSTSAADRAPMSARMRELGLRRRRHRRVGGAGAPGGAQCRRRRCRAASARCSRFPAADASYDFLYVINVLHHLASVDEQRRAFAELLRVLKPGGLLFVHEINTRNILFRFYMGYVFPSLNCIDEGVERWLLPHRLRRIHRRRRSWTCATSRSCRISSRQRSSRAAARRSSALLERRRCGVYSAHYMAVLDKAATSGVTTPVERGRLARRRRRRAGDRGGGRRDLAACPPRCTSSSGRRADRCGWRCWRRPGNSLRGSGCRTAAVGGGLLWCARRAAAVGHALPVASAAAAVALGRYRICRGCRIGCRCCSCWPVPCGGSLLAAAVAVLHRCDAGVSAVG